MIILPVQITKMKIKVHLFLHIFTVFLILSCTVFSQSAPPSPQSQKEARLMKAEPRMIYPFMKGKTMYSGVLPVENITNPADYTDSYKLVFDFAIGNPDDLKQGKSNMGIEEIIRILNLHRAAGIPENKLKAAVVIHGSGIMSFLRNEEYMKRFGVNNPNIDLIEQLQKKGVEFTECGQTLQFREIGIDKMMPGVHQSQSARTALSTYQLKGYVFFPVETD
jgi:intracellular sulfur oxidation DsrE/DsrF family protein